MGRRSRCCLRARRPALRGTRIRRRRCTSARWGVGRMAKAGRAGDVSGGTSSMAVASGAAGADLQVSNLGRIQDCIRADILRRTVVHPAGVGGKSRSGDVGGMLRSCDTARKLWHGSEVRPTRAVAMPPESTAQVHCSEARESGIAVRTLAPMTVEDTARGPSATTCASGESGGTDGRGPAISGEVTGSVNGIHTRHGRQEERSAGTTPTGC